RVGALTHGVGGVQDGLVADGGAGGGGEDGGGLLVVDHRGRAPQVVEAVGDLGGGGDGGLEDPLDQPLGLAPDGPVQHPQGAPGHGGGRDGVVHGPGLDRPEGDVEGGPGV